MTTKPIHGICLKCGRPYSGRCKCDSMPRRSFNDEELASINRRRVERSDNLFYTMLQRELTDLPKDEPLPPGFHSTAVLPGISAVRVGPCPATCDVCGWRDMCCRERG